MNFTVDQFANANGVEKPVAYGFLRYLAEKGQVSTSKAVKPEGTRGKPAVIYTFTPELAAQFGIQEFVPATPAETVSTVAESTSTEATAQA